MLVHIFNNDNLSGLFFSREIWRRLRKYIREGRWAIFTRTIVRSEIIVLQQNPSDHVYIHCCSISAFLQQSSVLPAEKESSKVEHQADSSMPRSAFRLCIHTAPGISQPISILCQESHQVLWQHPSWSGSWRKSFENRKRHQILYDLTMSHEGDLLDPIPKQDAGTTDEEIKLSNEWASKYYVPLEGLGLTWGGKT